MCGAQTLCGITTTVSNNMNAGSLQIGLFVHTGNGPECVNPHYRISFLILSREGELFFSWKARLQSSENYAHCLIPDMDWTRQSVYRLQDK